MVSDMFLVLLSPPPNHHAVYYPNTGQRLSNWTVLGHQITDLQVLDSSPPLPPVHHDHYSHSQPHSHRPSVVSTLHPEPLHIIPSIPSPQPPADTYEDPAILSVGRKPTQIDAFQALQEAPSTPVKNAPSIIEPLPNGPSSPYIGASRDSGNTRKRKKGKDAAATLIAPFSNLDITVAELENPDIIAEFVNELVKEESDEPTIREENLRRVSINRTRTGKPMDDVQDLPHVAKMKAQKAKQKARRNKQAGARAGLDHDDGEGETSPEAVRKGNSNGTFKGKGWRQTPILQEPQSISYPPSVKLTRRQRMEQEAQKGWATEDAGEIQELPEFDFAENLSKFDKRSVFDQIRTEDTTADEDRLVSFNRTPARPGTYGGKNLHPTENVLDSPKAGPRRTSTTQESDTGETFDFASGRARKTMTLRNSSKRPSFRNGDGVADDSAGQKELPRALRRFTPPESPSMSQTMPSAHFRIATSNSPCPTIMPAGMAAIEEVAESEFGLSAEMITESAGRGIAEVAMAVLGTASGKQATRESLRADMRPWAVIFAGNHRAGARALAAVRHLRERNIRTLTCIIGFERQNVELIPDVRRQAEILVKMGGIVRGWPDVQNYLKSEGRPELIIDAILAPGKTYDGLGIEDQHAVNECVTWSNGGGRAYSVKLSVDMPSGLNGSTGMFNTAVSPKSKARFVFPEDPIRCDLPLAQALGTCFAGEFPLVDAAGAQIIHFRADHVICIGAPRIGLLRALQKATVMVNSVQHVLHQAAEMMLRYQIWVVDVGVNRAWKQSGMASSKGVSFGGDWVVPLKLAEGVADA